jgi:hypothetical protein
MSNPTENPSNQAESLAQKQKGPQTPEYLQFDKTVHLDSKEHQADNVEFLSALSKISPEQQKKNLERAAAWEKKGDLDLLRAAGLSLDQLKQNPLDRHVQLASMFLERQSSPELIFKLHYSGNEMGQWDLDLADLLPANILKVDIIDNSGQVVCLDAVRGFADGRPGYFDTKTKTRINVQEGYLIKIKESQSSLALKEQRFGVQAFENSVKEEIYLTDNARKTVLKEEVRKEATKQNVEVKTDKNFFDVILTELNKLIDPKIWGNFGESFKKLDFSSIMSQISALVGGIGFAKVAGNAAGGSTSGQSDKKSGQSKGGQPQSGSGYFDAEKQSKLRSSSESANAPTIDRNWLLENVARSPEQVEKFMVRINFMGANMRVNKLIAPYLAEAEARARAAGINYQCKTAECGCQNWRPIRGGSAQSMHSWGTAIDLNTISNPWQPDLRGNSHGGKMRSDMPPEFVSIMKDVGFVWGGEWSGPADPMHFEMKANPYKNTNVLQSAPARDLANRYLV